MPKMKKTIQTVTNEKCKQASVMVWRYISAHGMADLHICKGTIDFGATYAAVKTMTFPRNSMSISAGPYQASFCKSYNSVAS